MKIFCFLLLTISISCLSPALLNSQEFQKQRTDLLKDAIVECSNLTTISFNDTFTKNYTFSSEFVLDFLPVNNLEQEVNKLNLPNDIKTLIISIKNKEKPTVEKSNHFNFNNKTKIMNLDMSMIFATKFNSTEGSYIGFLYLNGKTKAFLKDIYKLVILKVCPTGGDILKKCRYKKNIVEKLLTAEEIIVVEENVLSKTKLELNKLLLNKL